MPNLTKSERAKAPKALPGGEKGDKGKKFPIPDKKHARLAIAGASRAKNVGNITAAQEKKIDAKADAVLGKSKAKKKGK
jgi:hypothetical protein